jgi:hypothetical protein
MEHELMEIAKWFLQLKYWRNNRRTGSWQFPELTLNEFVIVRELAIARCDIGWPSFVLEVEVF